MLKKTTSTLKKSEIKPAWYLIDLKNKVLGRAVTKIAGILLGKNKPTFSTHIPSGGYVVIVNCKDIHITGNKKTDNSKIATKYVISSLKVSKIFRYLYIT